MGASIECGEYTMFLDECFGYTIYANPKDHPGHYVLRGWNLCSNGKTVFKDEAIAGILNYKTLQGMRYLLQQAGRINMGRADSDDRVIVETWI